MGKAAHDAGPHSRSAEQTQEKQRTNFQNLKKKKKGKFRKTAPDEATRKTKSGYQSCPVLWGPAASSPAGFAGEQVSHRPRACLLLTLAPAPSPLRLASSRWAADPFSYYLAGI